MFGTAIRRSVNGGGPVFLTVLACCVALKAVSALRADDVPNPADEPLAAGYVTLTSPIDDQLIGWVREVGLKLQNEAGKDERKAILVIEVTPGTSQFHHVYGLAEFLTSAALSRVTTVAWVPETVTGNNVLAALACKEIVLHPDAQLGDIGRGQAVPREQQEIVLNLVSKRHNKLVNRALAESMMNPQTTLLQLTVEPADGMSERRLVTEAEASRLRDSGVVIRDSRTIKEAGVPGLFSGAQARQQRLPGDECRGKSSRTGGGLWHAPGIAPREGASGNLRERRRDRG